MNNYNNQQLKSKIIKILLVVGLVIITIVGINTIINYGFISVDIANQQEYKLVLSSNNGDLTKDNYSNGSKIFVKKDAYNLAATNNNNESFVAAVKSSGFIKTTKIKGELKKGYGAKRIANNTNSCVVSSDKLYSINCVNGSNVLTTHYPANATSPAYQTDEESHLFWTAEIININGVNIGLSAGPDGSGYIISKFPNGEIVAEIKSAGNLQSNFNLGIKKYLDGFIVYSKDNVEAYYYKSFDATPVKIAFEQIEGYQFDIEIYKQYITYYIPFDILDEKETEEGFEQVISIYDGQKSFVQKIDIEQKKPFYCADSRICSLSSTENNSFIVSEIISEDSLSSEFEYFNVASYHIFNNNIGLANTDGFINYDPSNGTGYYLYRVHPSLTICGTHTIDGQPAICLSGEDGDNFVNLLSPSMSEPGDTNIDKKIIDLSNSDYIDTLTLNNGFIYINTNINPTYNEAAGRDTIDQEALRQAKDSINNDIDELGIDRNIYKIIIL